jgi:hypothetical protein
MLFNTKRVHGDDEVYMESPEEKRVHFLFILLNLLSFGKHDAASSWFQHLLSCHEVLLDYQDWISCCLVSKFQSGHECPVISQLEYFTALNYLVCIFRIACSGCVYSCLGPGGSHTSVFICLEICEM